VTEGIIARSEWTSRQVDAEDLDPGPLSEGFLHWPAIEDTPSVERVPELLRRIRKSHQEERGFRDIGYSFATIHNHIWELRGFGKEGAHTRGFNRSAYGLVVLTGIHDPISVETYNGIDRFFQIAEAGGHIRPWPDTRIHSHNQVKATQCPGPLLSMYSDALNGEGWAPPEPEPEPVVVSRELAELYRNVLGTEPTPYANEWQALIDHGRYTVDQVWRKLVEHELGRLRSE